jgi:hypothetical protein
VFKIRAATPRFSDVRGAQRGSATVPSFSQLYGEDRFFNTGFA